MNLRVPDYIRNLQPYPRGKPIEEAQRELKIQDVIKLASNENPFGPSPKAIAALQGHLRDLHFYPDGSAYYLRKALAAHLGVSDEQLLTAHGSNEIIDLSIRTFCLPGEKILTSKTAFVIYKLCAQIHGVATVESEEGSDLRFDLDRMLTLLESDPLIRMVFIANPNNPTGSYVSDSEMKKFLSAVSELTKKRSLVVVLDYAYQEFVRAKDLTDPIPFIKDYPFVLILRTFSKAYGLAGLRVGYGIGHPDVMGMVSRIRQPFNVNSGGMWAAEAALHDHDFLARCLENNVRGISFWEDALEDLKIPYWPTQGNFFLIDVQKGLGKTGPEAYEAALRKGVIFRPLLNYGLPQALRISIGKPQENQRAVEVLKDLKHKG